MSFHVAATTIHAGNGDLERARAHLATAEETARMWQDGAWHAAVTEARAAVHHAEGADPSAVVTLLRAAADRFADGDRPRDARRCRDAIAELH